MSMVREPRFSYKSFLAATQKVRRPPLAIRSADLITLRPSNLDETLAEAFLFAHKKKTPCGDSFFLCANQDSNLGPLEYQSSALPAELFAHINIFTTYTLFARLNSLPACVLRLLAADIFAAEPSRAFRAYFWKLVGKYYHKSEELESPPSLARGGLPLGVS
jgi:hypothetical protein